MKRILFLLIMAMTCSNAMEDKEIRSFDPRLTQEAFIDVHLRSLHLYFDHLDKTAETYSNLPAPLAANLWVGLLQNWNKEEDRRKKETITEFLKTMWKDKRIDVIYLVKSGIGFDHLFNSPFSKFSLTFEDEFEGNNLATIFDEIVLQGVQGKTLSLNIFKTSDRGELLPKHAEFIAMPSMVSSVKLKFTTSPKKDDSLYLSHFLKALASNTNLHSLTISGRVKFKRDTSQALATLFATNNHIRHIDLDTLQGTLSEFFGVLKTYTALQKLSLVDVPVGEIDTDNLTFHLDNNKNLESIALGEGVLNDTILKAVTRAIRENQNLKNLFLFGVANRQENLEEFAQALACNQSIQVLKLLNFNNSENRMAILMDALKSNTYLHHLGMDFEDLVNCNDIQLVNDFIKTTQTLTSLFLPEELFKDEKHRESFKEALMENSSLTEITIGEWMLHRNQDEFISSMSILKPSLKFTQRWYQ